MKRWESLSGLQMTTGEICKERRATMPERPTKEEIEAFEIRYLKDMADRYGGQLERSAASRRARLKEKARRAREQI